MKKLVIILLCTSSILAFSQDLDSNIYDSFLGTYELENGNEYTIGRSFVRLYLFNPQTEEYRGLYKENDSTWVSYNSLLKDSLSIKETTIIFQKKIGDGKILISENGKTYNATKSTKYVEEKVEFKSNGFKLKGTLLTPNQQEKFPAVIMVHGSGEQNRHGYASYIRIIADHLAKNGIAVLTYDKRGSGESEGDWSAASFEDLAQDALMANEFLTSYTQIDKSQIGLGGSSQAGWIIAKTTKRNPDIPFVFCISGAGMGISAAKQNIYNNITELKILGADMEILSKAENSWNHLYKYITTSNRKHAIALDENVNGISNNDFLNYFPPPSTTFSLKKKESWFQSLEINYDPIDDLKNYEGHIYTIFGELDASTPVNTVLSHLKPAMKKGKNKSHKIKIYPKSSHLILEATKKSDSEFSSLTKFHPYFLSDLSGWILKVTGHQSENISKVLKVEKNWLKAYETLDISLMETIVDNNFLITFPTGFTQNKNKVLTNLKSPSSNCSNMRIFTSKTSATEYTNLVILKGIVTTECTKREIKFIERQRYTDVYLKRGHQWKVISSHLSEYR